MKPPPPTHYVGHEKEHLQKHIRVKLYLVKQKKEQGNIDQPDGPAPDIGPGSQKNRYKTRNGSKELDIAHLVPPELEEDFIDVEKTHFNIN
jgi:hypothetical protein